jgi:hypothetical protein
MASTSSSFFIDERPEMSSFFATSIRCFFEAFASTPPAVGRSVLRPGPAACLSEGPLRPFGSQWSPTFSWVCFSAEKAVRRTRSPSSP